MIIAAFSGETGLSVSNQRESYPRADQRIGTLTKEQKEFLFFRCQLNTITGVVEDYANVFNWIQDLSNFKDDPESLRYMFSVYMESLEFLSYEARLQQNLMDKQAEYNAVLGTNFPALETFIPPKTKEDLQQLLNEMKNMLGVESVTAQADIVNRYTDEELLELIRRLVPIYEKAKQIIYGT